MISKERTQKSTNPAERAIGYVPPPLMVVLAIVSIQVGAALAVNLFPVLGPAGTVFWRVALSSLILIAIVRPEFKASVWEHRGVLLPYGIALGGMNWAFYESIARIPLGIAVTIEFMGPLAVAVFTSRRRIDLVWLALAITGLLALTPKLGTQLDPVGVMLAIAAGIGWGSFVILSKRVSSALPGDSGLVYGTIIASVALFPFAASSAGAVFDDVWLVGAIIVVALLSTTIPFYLEFAALKKLTAQTYGVLVTLEPAVAALVGAVMLREVLGIESIAAVVCVTIAAAGATWTRQR